MAIESGFGMVISIDDGTPSPQDISSEPSVRGMFHWVQAEGWLDWYDDLTSANRILVDREISKTFSYRFYIFHLSAVRFLRWRPFYNHA